MAKLPSSKSQLIMFALLAVAIGLVVAAVVMSAWLDADGNWVQIMAAVALGATVVAAAVLLSTGQAWQNGVRLSLAAGATGIVGVGSIALVAVTYIGGASDAGLPSGSGAAEVSAAGIALSEQVSNNDVQPPGYSHDLGTHPNYEGFMTMGDAAILRAVPGGTVLPEELPVLKEQIAEARAAALKWDTPEKAIAAGYYNTTNDVPFMGAHFLSSQFVGDGVFDPNKPEGLLFSRLGNPDGEFKLVGVWYLIMPGLNRGVTETIPPDGFAGNLDLWHEHHGLCTRAGIISENNTAEGCEADRGNFIGDLRWMMHVWVYPELADNCEGVFGYLNYNLWLKQGSPSAGLEEPAPSSQQANADCQESASANPAN